MKQQTFATSGTGIKDKTIIDYSGKVIYVGIDVHQKDYQVAKVLNGICIGNHRMEGRKSKVNRTFAETLPRRNL